MRKHLYLLLIGIFLLISASSFAFENEFFKVNSSKWKDETIANNNSFRFTLKDYEPEDPNMKMFPPTISVIVNQNEKGITHYIKDEKGFLENQKTIMEKDFQSDIQKIKENMLNFAMQAMPNTPKNQLEKMVEKEFNQTESEMGSVFYTKLGEHKAVEGNYKIIYFNIKTLYVLTLTKTFYIEIKHVESTDLSSLPAYKEFMSSLDLKDKVANKFNSETYPKIIKTVLYLIGGCLGLVLYFLHKKNSVA